MNAKENTRCMIINHVRRYPALEIRDVFKFLHQSSFGCEHLVSSCENAISYIKKEAESLRDTGTTVVEPLDGDYCRVHLSLLSHGISAETLGRLFFLSAKKEEQGIESLKAKLAVAKELCESGEIPFSAEEFASLADKWEANGFGAIHHSEAFRNNYHPAYRVISNEYASFLLLFAEIDKGLSKGELRLAIDGGSASGKTTLAAILERVYECTVLHMDDFFLRPEQRTPERFAEIGGNVDRERFLAEVLVPLSLGMTVSYRKFDCSTFTLTSPITVAHTPLTVIEGAYSMHPDLSDYYDLSVFLDITPELQRERILKRNSPKMAERFFNEWIPLEKVYFEKLNVKERCDIGINVR